ncbi:MAG: GNAT family N-acetyltransferase [Clostridia bacterium]|nr:GNAT family N-acetyltransferase [Clostridia bacterium]
MISLRKITEENFVNAFNLKLAPGQDRFVSHPVRSLAQAYVYREQCQPFGIYQDDEMVGYVMVIYDYDIPEYDIWHMMIDESKQGRGFGSAALDLALDYIRTKPFGPSDRVALTCHKENTRALALYKRKGFTETGAVYDEEIELALTGKA